VTPLCDTAAGADATDWRPSVGASAVVGRAHWKNLQREASWTKPTSTSTGSTLEA
jgi:hypothetical protein